MSYINFICEIILFDFEKGDGMSFVTENEYFIDMFK